MRASPSDPVRGRRRPIALAALACAALVGCFAAIREAKGPPAFDHAGHLRRELVCADCHEGAARARDPGMPSVSLCKECHGPRFDRDATLGWIEEWSAAQTESATARTVASLRAGPETPALGAPVDAPWPKGAAASPSGKGPEPSTWTASAAFGPTYRDVKFDHGKHAARGVSCVECHQPGRSLDKVADAPTLALAPQAGRPYGGIVSMGSCTGCHGHEGVSTSCTTCHETLGGPARGRPVNHDVAWTTRHGQASRTPDPSLVGEQCELCHSRASCDSCHARNAPRDHTNPFREATHGLSAAMDRTRCMACHEADSCVRCHQSKQPRSHRPGFGAPQDGHCVTCHLPVSGTGCIVCHPGTPSHAAAPPKAPFVSAHSTARDPSECLSCHRRISHPITMEDCNACHH